MGKMKDAILLAMLLPLGVFAGAARADNPLVTVEAPDQAAKGSEIMLRIHVAHKANTILHYINWVRVRVNGEEIKAWEYSMDHRPGAEFTKEVRLVIKEPSEVEVEANCSLQGTKGPVRKTIALTPSRP